MSKAHEFRGVILDTGATYAPGAVPPPVIASMDFVRRLQDESPIPVPDDARQKFADWVLNMMDRYSAHYARPVLDLIDGGGPECSACGGLWPLCGHHHWTTIGLDEEGES